MTFSQEVLFLSRTSNHKAIVSLVYFRPGFEVEDIEEDIEEVVRLVSPSQACWGSGPLIKCGETSMFAALMLCSCLHKGRLQSVPYPDIDVSGA